MACIIWYLSECIYVEFGSIILILKIPRTSYIWSYIVSFASIVHLLRKDVHVCRFLAHPVYSSRCVKGSSTIYIKEDNETLNHINDITAMPCVLKS